MTNTFFFFLVGTWPIHSLRFKTQTLQCWSVPHMQWDRSFMQLSFTDDDCPFLVKPLHAKRIPFPTQPPHSSLPTIRISLSLSLSLSETQEENTWSVSTLPKLCTLLSFFSHSFRHPLWITVVTFSVASTSTIFFSWQSMHCMFSWCTLLLFFDSVLFLFFIFWFHTLFFRCGFLVLDLKVKKKKKNWFLFPLK